MEEKNVVQNMCILKQMEMKRASEKQMEEMQREKKQKQSTVEPMEKSLDF